MNWHTQEINRVKKLTDEMLRYNILDCREAIAANPENPKCGQYTDTMHYCYAELRKRQALAKVEREQNMMARVHRNTSTADVDIALQQKIQRGEKLDDLEMAVAINRGYK
jgi:hypothetical protein